MQVATLRAKYAALVPVLTELRAACGRRRKRAPLATVASPWCPSGVTVTDAQLATVRLERRRFHGDWNYTIHPATPR